MMQLPAPHLLRSMLIAVLLSAATVAAAERPSLYGFAPAYPADTLPIFTVERNAPYTAYSRVVRMELSIDAAGAVTAGKAGAPADSLFYAYVAGYCKGLRFVPATTDGKPVKSVLPIEVVFFPRDDRPEFYFPVDRAGRITGTARYFAVFPQNGIQLPEVTAFPKYFARLHWADSSGQYPFVLLKLSLDAAGEVSAAEPVRSTLPAVTQTTTSAALWADYEPLRVKGKGRASECYLLVSFYPQLVYPTQPWVAAAADTMPPMERWRVRLLPDTAGITVPPVPRKVPGNEFDVPGAASYFAADTIGAVFTVDSLGALRVQRFDNKRGVLSSAIRQLTGKVPFYPAMTLDGRPVNFRGWVRGRGTGSGRIRVDYVW